MVMGMHVQTRDTRNKADEEAGKKQKKADLKKNISGLEDRLDLLQQEYRIKQIEKTDAVHCYARKRKIIEEMQAEKNNQTIKKVSELLMEYVTGENYRKLCMCYDEALRTIGEEIYRVQQQLEENLAQLNKLR